MAILESDLRSARNGSSDLVGSIHDAATAAKLGFRGGTVAGSIHMDQFASVLLRAFGTRFFQDGALSLYFLNATIDRESVRVYAEEPRGGATQIRVFMKREDGLDVSEGTASVGDPSKSALRILRALEPGMALGETQVRLGPERQRERIERGLCSGPLDYYLWFDALASDVGGRGIACMRMLLRFMKASSPLYA